jgi:hypothetical protein
MTAIHYDNRSSYVLCKREGGTKTKDISAVTCEECKQEISLLEWFVHYQTGEALLCSCVSIEKARRRSTITTDPRDVTCPICLHIMEPSRERWCVIGSIRDIV